MSLPKNPVPDPHADPLVASALRAAAGGAVEADGCPEAELLGLYAERDLPAGEHGRVETHVHGCVRCQAIVAALVRAMPPASVPAGATGAVKDDGFARWFAGWRWLVPATSLAAVALLTVWIGRGPADEVASSTGALEKDSESLAFAPPAAELTDRLDAPEVRQSADEADLRARTQAPQSPTRSAADPAAEAPATAQSNVAPGRTAMSAQSVEAQPDVPPAPTVADASPRAGAALERAVAGPVSAEVAGDARAKATVPAEDRAAAKKESVAPSAPAFRAALTFSPWRVVDGAVERTRDEGRSWQRVVTPAGVRVVAVASPGDDICWAIAADAVLRTIDGTTWRRTAPPTAERLVSIVATSAAGASIVTASGARFVTTDGGATWTPAP